MNASRLARSIGTATVLVLGAVLSSPASALDGAEAVFRAARTYTVRIKTQIDTPFLGDERGAFEGAGFLVDAERGWIVTNAHVVGQSPSKVQVAFSGGEYEAAHKVYVDSFADIAIVALGHPVRDRKSAPLDRAPRPTVGEPVGAYGHPLGLPFTGTRGIVSGYTDQDGPDLIQIDATVDHGNSGGPVIALRDGRVVGIATAGAGGDKSDRVNFATPIHDVVRILDLLRSGTNPSPPRLAFGLLKDEDGRHTMRVAASFDPRRWPFEPGDRIVAMQGVAQPVSNLSDLVRGLRGRTEPLTMTVDRNGRRVTLTVRPTLRPAIVERRGLLIDGALVSPIDFEDESDSVGAAHLAIHSVDPASTAQALSLGRLDILYSVDGRRFDDLDSLIAYMQSRPQGPAVIVVRRYTDDLRRVFEYHRRELPIEELRLVPEEAAPVAGK